MSDITNSLLKGAFSQARTTNTRSDGHYNVTGHINNYPVDLRVESVPRHHGSTRAGTSRSVQHHQSTRSVSQNYNTIPNNGNFEVKITKAEKSFAQMTLKSTNHNSNHSKPSSSGHTHGGPKAQSGSGSGARSGGSGARTGGSGARSGGSGASGARSGGSGGSGARSGGSGARSGGSGARSGGSGRK